MDLITNDNANKHGYMVVCCPCGRDFCVTKSDINKNPQEIVTCGNIVIDEEKKDTRQCGRKYSVLRLSKEYWRWHWYPETEMSE